MSRRDVLGAWLGLVACLLSGAAMLWLLHWVLRAAPAGDAMTTLVIDHEQWRLALLLLGGLAGGLYAFTWAMARLFGDDWWM